MGGRKWDLFCDCFHIASLFLTSNSIHLSSPWKKIQDRDLVFSPFSFLDLLEAFLFSLCHFPKKGGTPSGWVVVQKNLCDTLSLRQAKKKVVSILLIQDFYFYLSISLTCWKFRILLFSPTQVIGNSHCPLGTQDEKRGLIPKWINSTKVQSEPSLFRALEVNVKARKQFLYPCHNCSLYFPQSRIKDMKVKHEPHGTLARHGDMHDL